MDELQQLADFLRECRSFDCPRPARFLRVHSGGVPWADVERKHLANCQRCQTFDAKVFQKFATPALLQTLVLRAFVQQQVGCLTPSKRFSGNLADPPNVPFETADKNLWAGLSLREKDQHWLNLEHCELSSGTLLRAEFRPVGSGLSTIRYLVLRKGFPHPVAKICVQDVFAEPSRVNVRIDQVTSVVPNESEALRASIESVRRYDPTATLAWQTCAKRLLASNDDLTPDVRLVIEQFAEGR